jgi:hypothetical protein
VGRKGSLAFLATLVFSAGRLGGVVGEWLGDGRIVCDLERRCADVSRPRTPLAMTPPLDSLLTVSNGAAELGLRRWRPSGASLGQTA